MNNKMLAENQLEEIYHLDKERLKKTQVPIVTVSATFREDIKGWYGYPENENLPDVVFSRAHYSMAVALAEQLNFDPKQVWIVDPTNYVSSKDWKKIKLTEYIGKTIARHPFLKIMKDFVDKFGRSKLPILSSIELPLLYLTKDLNKPILSLHIAAGNFLAAHGIQVVQVVTDPHVREEYINFADKPNMTYCVFDQRTQFEFLEKAALLKKQIKPEQVIVTGPPIDPRIIAVRKRKSAWRQGPLHLCITTGGLGTNKAEIESLLKQLLPELRKKNEWLRILVYAATQRDIAEMVNTIAHDNKIKIGKFSDPSAKLRYLYHPQITDANELLIKYGFPWADGFVTKPSGDMAYDAAAAGCFILTLKEWGVWEENIRQIFEQKEIAKKLDLSNALLQLKFITQSKGIRGNSWAEMAMNNAFNLEPLFLRGSESIIKTYQQISRNNKKNKLNR